VPLGQGVLFKQRRQRGVPPWKDVILPLLALTVWKRLQIGTDLLHKHSCTVLTCEWCTVIVEKVKDTRIPFYRPALTKQESEGVLPDILTLMKQCWAEEPTERPSFDEIAKILKKINKGRSYLSISATFYTLSYTRKQVICLYCSDFFRCTRLHTAYRVRQKSSP